MMNGGISNGGGGVSCEKGLEYNENGIVGGDAAEKVKGNSADEVLEGLEDLEEYMDDISDRLMISRVVSDSLIKGMVTAVEQEAAESIAAKELEVANLKERLQSHEVSTLGKSSCSNDSCKKHEKMREDLNALRNLAKEQFKKVNKEIELVKGYNSLKKTGSSSELLGLGGILHEKQPESWMNVNKMLYGLKTTIDIVCSKVDDLLLSPNISSCEGLSANAGVQTESSNRQDEFEENSLEPNAQFCGIQNKNWLEKFNDVSSLGAKLDEILKSLSMSDTELVSHGSHDFERLHHKAFGNQVTNGENGTVNESDIHVAESFDFHSLKHMKNKELVDYFNDIITKMKRDHESALHQRTEEYFRLKREFLKEKGYSMTHRKDEEFDVLRKKIPKVISKLEDFLKENEKFPELTINLESMGKLKHRVETLLSENCDLRACLVEKENEVKILEMQVSHAVSELLQHSVAEENLVGNLKSELEDLRVEASLNQEIYETILREAAVPSESSSRYGINDERRICLETRVLEKEEELRLEIEEKEKLKEEILGLKTQVEQKDKLAMDLSQDLSRLEEHECSLVLLITDSKKDLESLRSQYLEAFEQIEALKQQLVQTKAVSAEASTERDKALTLIQQADEKLQLSEAREQTLRKEMEMASNRCSKICKDFEMLNQQLDQTKEASAEANRERDKAFTLVQQMRNKLLSSEAREQTLRKEMEMAANGFSIIIEDFECRVLRAIKSNTLRYIAQSYIYIMALQCKSAYWMIG